MFQLFKRKEVSTRIELHAIAKGKVIAIEEVPDNVFAEKMLGDGVGFKIEEDKIYAPCDGKIVMLADTRHALGIETDNGAQLLIHIGLNTVALKGEGLKALIKLGGKVKQGQALMQIDRSVMDRNSIDLTTPMIVTNISDFSIEKTNVSREVNTDSVVLKVCSA